MKFQLKCILINTKPRKGYYVADEGNLVTITAMDFKKGICKLSNGNTISIDRAQHLVAKLIGEVRSKNNTYTYSVVHGDYPIIMPDLGCSVNYADTVTEENRVYKTYAEALIDGQSIECEGDYEVILTKTEPNEVVEITDIDIIDKFQLYEKSDRLGVVAEFDKVNQIFKINLNNQTAIQEEPIVCKRKDFKKVHNPNTITMLRIQCPHCKRYGC